MWERFEGGRANLGSEKSGRKEGGEREGGVDGRRGKGEKCIRLCSF